MKMAMESVAGLVVAPGATETNMTALAGNTFTIRDSKAARMIGIFSRRETIQGALRILSPLLHDAVVGIHQNIPVPQSRILDMPVLQDLTPQDTLVLRATGATGAGEIDHSVFTVFYEGLAGIDGAFINAEELKRRGRGMYSPRNSLNVPVSGEYGTSVAINATDDQLKANDEYAIVGCTQTLSTLTTLVRYVSPDWGNLGVSIPWLPPWNQNIASRYFFRLAQMTGLPVIPVFNASNKDATLLTACGSLAGTTASLSTQLVRLAPK